MWVILILETYLLNPNLKQAQISVVHWENV